MTDISKKLATIRRAGTVRVALLSCPTPVLLDDNGRPYSPVRTNYFPHAQVLLASATKEEMNARRIEGSARVVDLKSIEHPDHWRNQLTPYGSVQYGAARLTKYLIGNGLDRLEQEIADADIVGITSNFTSEAASVCATIDSIQRTRPSALVVVGGRDASARPGFYLQNGADMVAQGDSDARFPEFVCNAVQQPPSLSLLTSRILPPARHPTAIGRIHFDLLPYLTRYKESGGGGFLCSYEDRPVAAYLETSRGCDRECDFCTERLTRRTNFDLHAIKDTVRHYKAHGIRTLLFSDDNILEWLNRLDGERILIELFTFLRDQCMIWEFSVGIELGRLFDCGERLRTDLVHALFWNNGDATHWEGAFRLLAPFENVGEEMTLYKKLCPWEKNLEVMEAILEKGIPQINVGIMFGWPTDTEENIQRIRSRMNEILDAKKRMNTKVVATGRPIQAGVNLSLFCLMPLPGTPLYTQLEQEGRIAYRIEEHPELWNVFASVVSGNHFRAENITEIRRELIREFDSDQPHGKVKAQWIENKG